MYIIFFKLELHLYFTFSVVHSKLDEFLFHSKTHFTASLGSKNWNLPPTTFFALSSCQFRSNLFLNQCTYV